jgi:PAS domain-containing protein
MFFNLAYPVCDIILLSFALALVAVFFGGQLALSWAVIAAGILLDALADLLFVYGAWNGLYYPDGRVNLLSAAFDVLYMAAYVVWVIGLFLRLRLPDPGKDVDLQKFIPESGKDFILVADNRGRVVYLDPALASILGMRDSAAGIGKTFGQLFGLPRAYEEAAIRKAAKTGLSDDYTVSLGLSRSKYRLRAVASSDPQQFPGYDILLHPDTKRPLPDRDDLLLGQVADRARTADRTRRFSSEEDPLRVYFNTLVDLLFILVSRAGGAGVGTAFEADVNDTARKAGCRFELRSGRAIWNEDGTASGIYRDLLEEAVRYANQVISASTIGRKLEEIERFMDPAVVREADEHRLRRARWPKDVAG